MKLHDVTLTISDDLPTWPGDPGVSMRLSGSLARGDSANVTRLDLGVHTGTHIDAPFHFEPEGVGVDRLPLAPLIGPCRLLDLTSLTTSIDRATLARRDWRGIRRVLFKTRNSAWWADEKPTFHSDFVYLATGGAEFLVAQGITLVGVDYLSVEKFKNPGHPTHHTLLRNNVIIIEGLNLNAVPEGDYELIALPMKLKGADGAPTRVVLRE